jgi:ABC-2 type transport system permease protein
MTVRDLGYKRYEGPRLPHGSRPRVLIGRTLSLQWASGLLKATFILACFPMVVCGVWIGIKSWGLSQLAARGVPTDQLMAQVGNPSDWVFYCIYWCQIWFAFTISLLAGAPAISDDVRSGAFQFYFARPVTRTHYLLGKLVPVWLLSLIVTAAPAFMLSMLRMAFSQSGAEVWHNLRLPFATLAYGLFSSAVLSLLPLAMSALSRRSGAVQGTWAAVFFLPWILGEALAKATDIPYAALVSIPTNLRLLGQGLYGMTPSYPVHWAIAAGILCALMVGSVLILLRRLERVEVFG